MLGSRKGSGLDRRSRFGFSRHDHRGTQRLNGQYEQNDGVANMQRGTAQHRRGIGVPGHLDQPEDEKPGGIKDIVSVRQPQIAGYSSSSSSSW